MCSDTINTINSYVEVNLNGIYSIEQIGTFGRNSSDNQYVTSYNLTYSIDGDIFIDDGISNPLTGI